MMSIKKSIQSASPKNKKRCIGLIALGLFVFVMITTAIVFSMFVYTSSNTRSDKIINITANAPLSEAQNTSSDEITVTNSDSSNSSSLSPSPDSYVSSDSVAGVTVKDNTTTWSNNTQIDIFEHMDSRVKSDGTGNYNNVIAPGTSNDYTFSIQNDINYAVKYTLNISGANDSEYDIPVQLQILDSDGTYLTGSDWVNISEMNNIGETCGLNPNTNKEYIIRWKWVFENDTDDYDTFLGNQSVYEEIACHINIDVVSEYDYDNPNYSDSDKPFFFDPTVIFTGENMIYIAGAAVIVVIMLIIIFITRKKRTEED